MRRVVIGMQASALLERLERLFAVAGAQLCRARQRVKLRVIALLFQCRRENSQRGIREIQLQAHAGQELARLDVFRCAVDHLRELTLGLQEVSLRKLCSPQHHPRLHEVRRGDQQALEVSNTRRVIAACQEDACTQ